MDYKDIKKLIDDMGNSKLDEIKIEFPEGMKIEMKKNVGEKVFVNSNIQQIEKEDIQTMSIQKNDENKGCYEKWNIFLKISNGWNFL